MNQLNPSENDKKQLLTIEQTLFSLERTFLAWVRTGLTALGIGLAISQFIIFKNVQDHEVGYRIGQLLVLWGVFSFIFAFISYRKRYFEINPNGNMKNFSCSGLSIITIFLIFFSCILFWLVVK